MKVLDPVLSIDDAETQLIQIGWRLTALMPTASRKYWWAFATRINDSQPMQKRSRSGSGALRALLFACQQAPACALRDGRSAPLQHDDDETDTEPAASSTLGAVSAAVST